MGQSQTGCKPSRQASGAGASSTDVDSVKRNNVGRALNLSEHGRYGPAMQSLSSFGCASEDDNEALDELVERHPTHPLPTVSDEMPLPLSVDSVSVLSALNAFPNGSSPGSSKLRAQHLIDATSGNISLDAQICLDHLTKLVNKLLAEKMDKAIAP